jgi:hypothetical protein
MSYIGSTPTSQAFAPGTDTFSGTGSQVAFTLSRNVATVNDILVVVNNVDQQPTAYSVASNVLTFTAAPSSGTNNIYVRYLSTNLITIAPQQGSVTQKSMDVGSGGVGTGAAQMPVGTTSDRPATPLTGMYRMNSTLNNPEWYDAVNSAWVPFSDLSSYTVEVLAVAGGGGGGYEIGGGGGAGGVVYLTTTPLATRTSYTVLVGAAGTPASTNITPGTNGGNSQFGSFTAAIGGGYGGNNAALAAGSGGSGGGAGEAGYQGSGTSGQGYGGGNAVGGPGYGSGGGGGAGAVGQTGTTTAGGAGGAGTNTYSTWASATSTGVGGYYAGGGGGGAYTGYTAGAGGAGGGGAAGTPATAGTANTGGGGGGYKYNGTSAAGAAGGSGIVIIRYAGIQRGAGGTVTSSGGYTYHTFTTSGTFTA